MRQGDILNPFFFNTVLEHAMRKWKLKLTNEGLRLGQDIRLTNLRYADDLMIFATSREELVFMVETLAQTYFPYCIAVEWHETKVLTTLPYKRHHMSKYVGLWLQFAWRNDTQISDLNIRTEVEIMYRIQCASTSQNSHPGYLAQSKLQTMLHVQLCQKPMSSPSWQTKSRIAIPMFC